VSSRTFALRRRCRLPPSVDPGAEAAAPSTTAATRGHPIGLTRSRLPADRVMSLEASVTGRRRWHTRIGCRGDLRRGSPSSDSRKQGGVGRSAASSSIRPMARLAGSETAQRSTLLRSRGHGEVDDRVRAARANRRWRGRGGRAVSPHVAQSSGHDRSRFTHATPDHGADGAVFTPREPGVVLDLRLA